MSRLIPGYRSLAEEERARQAAVHRIDCLPWSPTVVAGPIHVVDSAAQALAWAERLHNEPISMMGVDTEFTFDSPPIKMRSGKEFQDIRSIRPLVCTIAAWCGSTSPQGSPGEDLLIRLLFDLRRQEVHAGLKRLLELHVPWVAHAAKAELHCLWACGIEPAEHLLLDTFVTAAAINLGRFHQRQRIVDADEEVARARKLDEKRSHVTSLVGQCECYALPYPFTKEQKKVFRERFLQLGPNDKLDDGMVAYAMSDAEFALRLHLAQARDVHRFGLAPHLGTVEWPLVGALARMEWTGLPVNSRRMQEYRELCRAITKVMADQLIAMGIKPGSRNSFLKAMHNARVLQHFVRKEKYSTQEKVLRECERIGVHPAVRPFRLHQYFQRQANSEFLAGLLVGGDGRQRCSLDQLRSASGRIASSRPNLIGLDKRLRPVVEAPAGWTLIELDYSQKEVGLAGAEWDDDELVRQFNLGDSYSGVAQVFYADQLSAAEKAMSPKEFKGARPDLRDNAKPLLLGALYGTGASGVAERFKCSLSHAEAELQRFYECFPKVRDNANAAVRRSLRRGYGLTVTALRRFIELGDGRYKNAMRNHPIQGGAAAIFKTALLRIDGYFRGTPTQLLLPRHDSILLLTPTGTEEDVIGVCRVIMVQAVREKYPQLHPRVDAKPGSCWPTDLTLEAYHEKERVGTLSPCPPPTAPTVPANTTLVLADAVDDHHG